MAKEVAILGVGMHPWGKWGKNFVEYGVKACQDALADAGLEWKDIQFVAGARHDAQRLPGLRRRRHVRAGARLDGGARRELATPPARRARRRSTPRGRRSSPGSATSRWSSAPTRRRRASSPRRQASAATIPTGCASACSARPTRPTSRSTRGAAWTCTAPPTATSPRVKVKNSKHGLTNPNARYRKEVTVEEVLVVADGLRSAAPARDLRHERRRRGGGAGEHGLRTQAHHQAGDGRGHLHGHAALPEHGHRDAELRDRLRRQRPGAGHCVPRLDRGRGIRGGGHSGPKT